MKHSQGHIASFLKACIEDNQYSPDICQLQQKFSRVPLFVYGSEKRSFQDHLILRGSELVGYGFTTAPLYMLYVHKATHSPILIRESGNTNALRVQGEVWSVPIEDLPDLDNWFNNTDICSRHRRLITFWPEAQKSSKEKIKLASECYIYEYDMDYKRLHATELEPCARLRNDAHLYFAWRKLDERGSEGRAML